MFVGRYVCMLACMYVCLHISIYIYIHVYTHMAVCCALHLLCNSFIISLNSSFFYHNPIIILI